ncbi:MAG TPA: DUF6798 domain-containing protein [Tepidisphaeraceae bacterium]|nr:DUF6798 domain-containing protein [Tepidisphaeraceae bacterium]
MPEAARDRADGWLAIAFGAAVTLVLGGYQFGRSNHAVYLLDALHRADPTLLANDWFTTGTLQYHALFGVICRWLWASGVIEPAFLVGYLALVVLLHAAWLGIARLIGGTHRTYFISVLLTYASANATGLGMYQFLQDSAFLPSNVAAVALLWAVYAYARGHYVLAGAATMTAALFHLNYAIVGAGLWVGLTVWRAWDSRVAAGFSPLVGSRLVRGNVNRSQDTTGGLKPAATALLSRPWVLGSLLALVPALACVVVAWRAMPHDRPRMPLGEFVDLYVRLRHPHHYDPSSWPTGLWIAFLWPVPLAAWTYVRTVRREGQATNQASRQLGRTFALLAAPVAVALVFAGIWYVSETLVQLSLFRFTPHLQLLACVAAAWLVWDERAFGKLAAWVAPGVAALMVVAAAAFAWRPELAGASLAMRPVPLVIGAVVAITGWAALSPPRPGAVVRTVAFVGVTAGLIVGWPHLGVVRPPVDPAYADVQVWARDHTPVDAIFLVPPDEETFRLAARRAVVVNFKGVPQLSAELPQWRDRLQDVLDLPDLRVLPRPFYRTLSDIRRRYSEVEPPHLIATADKYGAAYIVATRPLAHPRLRLQYASSPAGYFLYHLPPAPPG